MQVGTDVGYRLERACPAPRPPISAGRPRSRPAFSSRPARPSSQKSPSCTGRAQPPPPRCTPRSQLNRLHAGCAARNMRAPCSMPYPRRSSAPDAHALGGISLKLLHVLAAHHGAALELHFLLKHEQEANPLRNDHTSLPFSSNARCLVRSFVSSAPFFSLFHFSPMTSLLNDLRFSLSFHDNVISHAKKWASLGCFGIGATSRRQRRLGISARGWCRCCFSALSGQQRLCA